MQMKRQCISLLLFNLLYHSAAGKKKIYIYMFFFMYIKKKQFQQAKCVDSSSESVRRKAFMQLLLHCWKRKCLSLGLVSARVP